MPRVLVIDDDPGTLLTFHFLLHDAGFEVQVAESGRQGLDLAQRCAPHLVLSDLRLPDLSGLDVLRHLRNRSVDVPFVMMSAFSATDAVVEAMRSGACDFVDKPLSGDGLVHIVSRALGNKPLSTPIPQLVNEQRENRYFSRTAPHTVLRWADSVARVVDFEEDPTTLEKWAHGVHVSRSVIKSRCELVSASARKSLDFARLLRAVVRRPSEGGRAEHLLNVAEPRTLFKLIRLAGGANDLPHDTHSFLDHQRLIVDSALLGELRLLLRARGLLER